MCDSGYEYNNKACAWDGGDCCEESCDSEDGASYGYECGGQEDYDCKNPAYGPTTTMMTTPFCDEDSMDLAGDSACDTGKSNTAMCNWDGGDCCPGTCAGDVCGAAGYECLDPKFDNIIGGESSDFTCIGSGLNNAISENSDYSTIDGGQGNQIYKADYGTVSGGLKNVVFSKHATIGGGFENEVAGRLSTIPGGSRNTAKGRHSALMGYKAFSQASVSMVAAFNGDVVGADSMTNNDAECLLGADDDFSIKVCADSVLLNDVDVLALLTTSQRQLSLMDRSSALDQRIDDLDVKMAVRQADFVKQMVEQTKMLTEQAKKLQ